MPGAGDLYMIPLGQQSPDTPVFRILLSSAPARRRR